MPESGKTERSNWQASGRNGYTAIDRFKGDKCQEFLTRFRSAREAEVVASHLNRAYQLGREEMLKELSDLAAQDGGMFYVTTMLGTGIEAFVQTEPQTEPQTETQKTLARLAEQRQHYKSEALPGSALHDKPYIPGETRCVNHACTADRPHSHAERSIRSEVIPLTHEPSLGCCAEHFNASPGNPVSP